MCYVEGFPDEKHALRFEWRWKNLSTFGSRRKKKVNKKNYLEDYGVKGKRHAAKMRRCNGLMNLLYLKKYTFKSDLASTMPLTLVWEDPEVELGRHLASLLPSHVSYKEICS